MSTTLRILFALLLGIAAGALLRSVGGDMLPIAQGIADPLGGLWLSALRMSIVPLVFAFQTPEKLYMVTEYCPGGELFFHLKQKKRFKVSFFFCSCVLAIIFPFLSVI